MDVETAPTSSCSHWAIDPRESTIAFRVEYRSLTTVRGIARGLTGTITYDAAEPTRSSLNVTIDAASVATDDPSRDVHLRSPDFFDVAHFPTITFVSRQIVPRGRDEYDVRGDLTIRGHTHEVILQVALEGETLDYAGRCCADFDARTTIRLADFGLTWNQDLAAGWIPVGDRVIVTIRAEAIKTD